MQCTGIQHPGNVYLHGSTRVTSINVTMWGGAGGGSGSQSGTYFYDSRWAQDYYSFGGAGGYSACTISVTPGEKLTIRVLALVA